MALQGALKVLTSNGNIAISLRLLDGESAIGIIPVHLVLKEVIQMVDGNIMGIDQEE